MKSATLFLLIFVAILATNAAPPKAKPNTKSFRLPLKRVIRTMSKLDRRESSRHPLIHDSTAYAVSVGFGNPPQEFNLVVSTAVDNIMVADATCGNCGQPAKIPEYNGGASSSFVDLKDPYAAWGTVAGTWTTDDIALIGDSFNRHFIRLSTVDNDWVNQGKFSGILGLGLHKDVPAYDTLLEYLATTDVLDELIVGCRFVNGGGDTAGDIVFGGIQSEYIDGEIHHTPVLNDDITKWDVPITDIKRDDTSFGQMNARLDTGNNYIYLDKDIVAALFANTPAQRTPDGIWTVPDPWDSDVTFYIGDGLIPYIVPKTAIPLKQFPIGNMFAAAIQEGVVGVLGLPFIEQFYVVFDFTPGSENVGLGYRLA